MDSITQLIVLLCLLTIAITKWKNRSKNFPPGPYSFPITGNILQIYRNPHKTLAKLSKTYGPIMSLKLGTTNFVVISSPDIAKLTLTKYDNVLSIRRPIPLAAQAHDHHQVSMSFLPVGSRWKKLRRICKEHIFSPSRLRACSSLRQEKLRQMREYVEQCHVKGIAVNIEETAFITALNLMSNTIFSTDFAPLGSEDSQEMKKIVQGVITSISAPNLADSFSVLEVFDPQGIKRRANFYVGKLLTMFEEKINDRLEGKGAVSKSPVQRDDFLEMLLNLRQRNQYEMSYNEIKHLLLDLFLGGTDTTSNTVDWAMTELLMNPKKMSILKEEIIAIVGKSSTVTESDNSRLPYLHAVIKEVFRYHPPAPFLIPHKAETDFEINGYRIPKDTRLIINAWAIGRDSGVWSNPDSFEPERFLESKIDIKGQDFELIPFGSGRRICPGLPLALEMIHLMVATLVHNFDWEAQELDTNERFGLSLRRVHPLRAFPVNLCRY